MGSPFEFLAFSALRRDSSSDVLGDSQQPGYLELGGINGRRTLSERSHLDGKIVPWLRPGY